MVDKGTLFVIDNENLDDKEIKYELVTEQVFTINMEKVKLLRKYSDVARILNKRIEQAKLIRNLFAKAVMIYDDEYNVWNRPKKVEKTTDEYSADRDKAKDIEIKIEKDINPKTFEKDKKRIKRLLKLDKRICNGTICKYAKSSPFTTKFSDIKIVIANKYHFYLIINKEIYDEDLREIFNGLLEKQYNRKLSYEDTKYKLIKEKKN